MPQYNRNDLEIAARNQYFTRDTFEKVLRLKTIVCNFVSSFSVQSQISEKR